MKKYLKIFLPILIATPLLSAYNRLPEVYSRSYKDYELVYQRHEYVGEDIYYYYDIQNSGDAFIEDIRIDDGGFYYNVASKDYYELFKNTVFGPGLTKNIAFKSNHYYLEKPEKPKSFAYAYLRDDTAIVLGTKAVNKASKGKDYYLYNIDLSIDNTNNKNDYAAIIELSYETGTYYIKIDQRDVFQFATTEELDLTQLNVNSVSVVSSVRSRNGSTLYSNMMALLLMIIFFGILPIGIFSAIFFPKLARRRRARLREGKGS